MAPITMRTRLGCVRSMATSRMAASGGTRDALIAGMIEVSTETPMPTMNAAWTVLAFKTRPPAGRSRPNAASRLFKSAAHAEPDDETGDRRDDADDERFADHRREHLPSDRAERSQQRHLTGALRDDDRERVVDAEDRHEDRDERRTGAAGC